MSRAAKRAQRSEQRKRNKRGDWIGWHRRIYHSHAVLRNGVYEVTIRHAENDILHLAVNTGAEGKVPSASDLKRIVKELIRDNAEYTRTMPPEARKEDDNVPEDTSMVYHLWVLPEPEPLKWGVDIG